MYNIDIRVPDGCRGNYRVETFVVTEADSEFSGIRAMMHPEEFILPGTYKRLMCGHEILMSNTRMEMQSHYPIICRAKGNVLINGLGLGVVLAGILQKPEVSHVTVIELSPEVIELVAPTYLVDKRVKVIQEDAFNYKPMRGERFDAVWHDIWTYICADNLEEMSRLYRKYSRKTSWQGAWQRDYCLRARSSTSWR